MNFFLGKPAKLLPELSLIVVFATMFGCTDDRSGSSSSFDAGPESEDTSTDIALELDRNLYLDELSQEELQELCEWMVEIQGGPHTVDCGDGVSVTVDPVDDCLSRTYWPHCRVGLHAECVDSQASDLCAGSTSECEEFYSCVYGK